MTNKEYLITHFDELEKLLDVIIDLCDASGVCFGEELLRLFPSSTYHLNCDECCKGCINDFLNKEYEVINNGICKTKS